MDASRVSLSPEAEDFIEKLITAHAVDFSNVGPVQEGEIAIEVRNLIDKAAAARSVDAEFTSDMRALAWTITWAVINERRLLQTTVSTAFDEGKIAVRPSNRESPVYNYLTKDFVNHLLRTTYVAVCLALAYRETL